MFSTMTDIRAANKANQGHFFDREVMRVFRSRVESGVLYGQFFITSESYDDTSPRFYTVRVATPRGQVRTFNVPGSHNKHASLRSAKEWLTLYLDKQRCGDVQENTSNLSV
jgi:hypothetical protein